MKLQYKMTLFFVLILAIVIWTIGFFGLKNYENSLEVQMGNNAMDIAVTLASMEKVQEKLADKDYHAVQEIIEGIRVNTRFQYIIVIDMEGIKYSYPTAYGLGKPYISGGEEEVLKTGEAYVSADRNELISAIRAFVPIYYENDQIGAVIVGLLKDRVTEENQSYYHLLYMTFFIAALLGLISATLLSLNIKKSIFGLEPKEIALLLGQRDLILHSFKNGIIAVGEDKKIIFYNDTAKKIFDFKRDITGEDVEVLCPHYRVLLEEVLATGESIYNQEMRVTPYKTLVSSHTIMRNHRNEVIGIVSDFQDLTEIKQMAEELTGVKKMTHALRAQNHEFMNKLHTISGLIQLGEYDKAVSYISDVSRIRAELSTTLNKRIKNSHIAALLLAKYNKVAEMKIELNINPNSHLEKLPETVSADDFCSILGNLIENSIDELLEVDYQGVIEVDFASEQEGLYMSVTDNGRGISEEKQQKIFERGYSTKDGNRGLGLDIVKRIVDDSNGVIDVTSEEGTTIEVFIPME
ncbi:ATP-binding protein [Vallitalea okinawensis]|uniref:ATP-binding protein n=1 Tax=Vallitalea okinawensis TaxID=2078660 RepID=UPI000CFBD684|nr:sensor histidine kinase [Vallitalea okinawensis]